MYISLYLIGILVNNSHFICEIILKIFNSLSYGVDIFCKEFVKKDLNFTTLKENIYNIKGIEKSDFLSVLGLIKGMISFGSISMLKIYLG